MKIGTKRKAATVGTIRVYTVNGRQHRVIKFREATGGRDWMAYARWWWLANRGPIPAGWIVLHKNGNSMDDRPENLTLGKPSDAAFLAEQNRPQAAKRWKAKMVAALTEANRYRGRVHRALGYNLRNWYAVNHTTKTIQNTPCHARHQVFATVGCPIQCLPNGRGAEAAALGWPKMEPAAAYVMTILAGVTEMDARELKARVAAMRRARGQKSADSRDALYRTVFPIRHLGFVSVRRRGGQPGLWSLTDAGRAARGPWTEVVPAKGSECIELERQGYRKHDAPESSRVSAREAVLRLARVMAGGEELSA